MNGIDVRAQPLEGLWSNIGLGLSVAYRIITEHKGKIEVQTPKKVVPGEGLTVTLELQNAPGGKKPLKLTTVAFSTGEYEFIGVPPGSYKVSLDAAQVAQFGYIAKEIFHIIEIHAKAEGEEVAGVDFSLSK